MRTTLFVSIVSLMLLGACSRGPDSSPRLEADWGDADQLLVGQYVLYRLDGDRYPGEAVPPGTQLLHGWSILDRCDVESGVDRHRMLASFYAGQDEMSDPGGIPPVDCFQPRHAIRIVKDGTTTDYLICFQCANYMIWTDGEQTASGMTSESPRATLEDLLESCRS